MPDFLRWPPIFDRRRSNGRFTTTQKHLIELVNVVKIYESTAGRFVALQGINLNIDAGEFVAVVGKSGSGKSTLLNMITGIDRPTLGEVWVNGVSLNQLSESRMAVWRGHTLGIIFQFFQLLPTLTVIENVMLPMDFCHKYSYRERRHRALQLLEEVELLDQAYKLPAALSGGQQQRVAIARAMANDPPLLLADEPTGNLDTKTAASVFSLFEKLVQEGKTILMVTHDQELAKRLSRTIFISDGKITADSKEPEIEIASPRLSRRKKASSPREDKTSDEELDEMHRRVAKILEDRPTAANRLRQEFEAAANSRVRTDALYRVILTEVEKATRVAENAGHPADARALWKILLDATEPWSKARSQSATDLESGPVRPDPRPSPKNRSTNQSNREESDGEE